MIKEVESKWYDVEILRCLRRDLYFNSVHNPCRHTRGRSGWELYKVTKSLQARQKELVQLSDQAVSEEELYKFLKSQNINLQPL